ncbi:MAG: IPT/TIG domain-containing protein [Spirochaetes bacterium]|nr:IPT/TIG domain-containing protein [Spirochaetota bacterium]
MKYILKIFVLILTFLFTSSYYEKYYIIKPEIFGVHPKKTYVGETVTIYGKNFKHYKDKSEISFGGADCQDYDFDYIYWSDNIIKVKVPTGAKSGNIELKIDNEKIVGPSVYLYNENCFIYSNPMDVTVDYSLKIFSNCDIKNPLYLWLPTAVSSDTQRNIIILNKSKNHFQTQMNGLDLFKINKFESNKIVTISKKFKYKSYQLDTTINPDFVTNDYNFKSDFYKYYTSPQGGIESSDPRIINLSKAIVKDETNPYYKAKLIYNWVVDNISYQFPPINTIWRAMDCLETGIGDCSVYSFLFCALCRAAGVPARAVAGHVIFIDETISVHVWAEFFLPKYGWIPVDANYGDIQVNGFLNKDKYFGCLDNRHIAFSKGRVLCEFPEEINYKENFVSLNFLQKYHTFANESQDKFIIYKSIKRIL